jgi:hypothetical protein
MGERQNRALSCEIYEENQDNNFRIRIRPGAPRPAPGRPIDFLGMHIETTVSHYISPAVGAIALIGGILLLVVKPGRV